LTNECLKQEYLKPALDEIVKQINENGQQCSVKMCKGFLYDYYSQLLFLSNSFSNTRLAENDIVL